MVLTVTKEKYELMKSIQHKDLTIEQRAYECGVSLQTAVHFIQDLEKVGALKSEIVGRRKIIKTTPLGDRMIQRFSIIEEIPDLEIKI